MLDRGRILHMPSLIYSNNQNKAEKQGRGNLVQRRVIGWGNCQSSSVGWVSLATAVSKLVVNERRCLAWFDKFPRMMMGLVVSS